MKIRVLPIGLLIVAFGASLAGTASGADKKACFDSADRGQALRDSGDLLAARDLFKTCSDATCPAPIPKFCTGWLAETEKRLASLVVHIEVSVTGPPRAVTDVTFKIDGVPTAVGDKALVVNPGRHELAVEWRGQTSTQNVSLADGEKEHPVTFKLTESTPAAQEKPTKDEQPSRGSRGPIPIPTWIGWGVGVAGLAGFVGFGLAARSDFDDFKRTCGNTCTPDARDDVARSMVFADVFLAVGLVSAAAGTLYYLTRPAIDAPPKSAAAGAGRTGGRW